MNSSVAPVYSNGFNSCLLDEALLSRLYDNRVKCAKSHNTNFNDLVNEAIVMDSALLKLNVNFCKHIDSRISERIAKVSISEDGELLDVSISDLRKEAEFKRTALCYEHKGIKFTFSMKEFCNPKTNAVSSYLYIAISSKMLGSDYMQGIDNSTVKKLYNVLMELNLFSVDYSDFLKAGIADIDFKCDRLMSVKERDTYLSELERCTKEKFKLISKRFKQKLNHGFQVSDRKRADYPFLKFYSKNEDLVTKDNSRFNELFVGADVDSDSRVLRMELTIKGSATATSMNLVSKDETLKLRTVLFLIDRKTELNRIFTDVMKEYFHDTETEPNNDIREMEAPEATNKRFSAKTNTAIYRACYRLAYKFADATEFDCYEMALDILGDMTVKMLETFAPVAKETASRAFHDARNDINKTTLMKSKKNSPLFSTFGLAQ